MPTEDDYLGWWDDDAVGGSQPSVDVPIQLSKDEVRRVKDFANNTWMSLDITTLLCLLSGAKSKAEMNDKIWAWLSIQYPAQARLVTQTKRVR